MPEVKPILPALTKAVTQDAVTSTPYARDEDEVKTSLLAIAIDLLRVYGYTKHFGRARLDPFTPSLQTLYFRLRDGYLALSPLKHQTTDEDHIKKMIHLRTPKKPIARPLEDFEDIYYAMLAKIRDMHQLIHIRVGSAFNQPEDVLFTAYDMTIAEFHHWLCKQWGVLNSPSFVKALDDAVRRSHVKHLHQDVLMQLHAGDLTQDDVNELLADLYDPIEYENVEGCAWVAGWSAAMISAWLKEKYHVVMKVEKEAAQEWKRREKIVESTATVDMAGDKARHKMIIKGEQERKEKETRVQIAKVMEEQERKQRELLAEITNLQTEITRFRAEENARREKIIKMEHERNQRELRADMTKHKAEEQARRGRIFEEEQGRKHSDMQTQTIKNDAEEQVHLERLTKKQQEWMEREWQNAIEIEKELAENLRLRRLVHEHNERIAAKEKEEKKQKKADMRAIGQQRVVEYLRDIEHIEPVRRMAPFYLNHQQGFGKGYGGPVPRAWNGVMHVFGDGYGAPVQQVCSSDTQSFGSCNGGPVQMVWGADMPVGNGLCYDGLY